MKTLVCSKPGVWDWKTEDKPSLAEDEVLVKIKRIGVCGTDLHAFQGNQAFFEYPRVLGHELSGVIDDAGNSDFSVGQAVLIIPYLHCGDCLACRKGATNCCANMRVIGVHQDGGMREYLNVPKSHVLAVDGVDFDSMALVECLAIGAHAVRRGNVQKGDDVVIVGAGPIGLGCAQFAKANGARVIVVDMNDERLEFCQKEFGVDVVKAGADAVSSISELTNGDFASVVIDATGHAGAMVGSIEFCGHAANLVYVGLTKGQLTYTHTDIHKKELTLFCSRNATLEDFSRVTDLMRDGRVVSTCMVTHRSSFSDMPEQFTDWLKPETGVVKAVVELD
ncbi:MAG: zinc-binding alcohol dehydrogenase family protein [Lentisphaeraceae bacterium]|nr:zinc-binding alcohol dehydrogenase family protein [Lentisphaeraceae bacterium]